MKKIILSGIVAVALFASANIMAQDVPTKAKADAKKAKVELGEAKHEASSEVKAAKKDAKADVKTAKKAAKADVQATKKDVKTVKAEVDSKVKK